MFNFDKPMKPKANDNRKVCYFPKAKTPPQMTGGFATDGLALMGYWDMTEKEMDGWSNCFASYSVEIATALHRVDAKVERFVSQDVARYTAMAIATIDSLFAQIERLPITEQIFILNNLNTSTDKFIQAQKQA